MLIYEPKGKAREYSPLALNYYSGCDHNCNYCYVPAIRRFDKSYNHSKVWVKPHVLENLGKEAKKHYNSPHPIFLSFMSDPYCKANDELQITKQVLEILLENRIPVSILTKGGLRALQDIEIFKKFGDHIEVGTTLTFNNDNDSLKYEPGAALPDERLKMLKMLNANNIKTWVSIEPVIKPEQSLNLLEKTVKIADKFKVGKLNHNPKIEKTIDWQQFLYDSMKILLNNLYFTNKGFYIKKDLAVFGGEKIWLRKCETDPDFLNLKPFPKN